MEPTDKDLLAAAREMARQLGAAHSIASLPRDGDVISRTELAELAERHPSAAQLASTMRILRHDALECMDRTPKAAWSLAHIAYALAHAGGDLRTQAEAALTLAMALNALGEFCDARPIARQAAQLFDQCGDPENSARCLCEAAWADTFTGHLSEAKQELQRIRVSQPTIALLARCDWIEARVSRDQGNYAQAETGFTKAGLVFEAAPLPLDAARCERELARTFLLVDRDPSPLLLHARQIFGSLDCLADIALCDWIRALRLREMNEYPQALKLLSEARQNLADLGLGYYAAICDIDIGIINSHLNRYAAALTAARQARDYILSHGIRAEVSACDINLGNTYYALNKYAEALTLYQEAADLSLAEERVVRAARVYSNMGLVYAKQGHFAKALALGHKALQISTDRNTRVLAAHCHVNLAAAYRQLGQYAEALDHLRQARAVFAEHQLREYLADCTIALADVHLARGEISEATICLQQARDVCVQDQFDSLVAVCDRLLAQIVEPGGDHKHALALIQASRATFLKHNQVVDAALCDLTEGELRLAWNEIRRAKDQFHGARQILSPGFPDQAWRANYGLAHCEMQLGYPAKALKHFLTAVRAIAQSRSTLVTEQLSNDFFARRQSVYDEAISLALEQGDDAAVLEVIEASKARICLTLLQNRDWKLRPTAGDDPYIRNLVTRETELRYQLDALRRKIAIQTERPSGEVLRGAAELASISGAALQELTAVSQAYESVVAQLRLAAGGLAGVSAPIPFSLDTFRHAANASFGSDWVALDYYLADDWLVVVIVEAHQVRAQKKTLSDYDRTVLDECVSTERDLRELIYRGTLRGERVPSPGKRYLRHLHRLLIPQGLDQTTLIISPHGSLHGLPFHALIAPRGNAYLIEEHPVVYAPSLQVMQLLLSESRNEEMRQPLVLGLSQFGESLPALPLTRTEVTRLQELFGEDGVYLSEEQATRSKVFELDASGQLQKFGIVHFATHAELDRAAPHNSRVVLADEALTAADVLDLTLAARLVTLSACHTAIGQGGPGDELIGLARAFFYAGAQALLATLWSVEDGSSVEVTTRTYRHWLSGQTFVNALRRAQCEMIQENYSPYQWAPLALMGKP